MKLARVINPDTGRPRKSVHVLDDSGVSLCKSKLETEWSEVSPEEEITCGSCWMMMIRKSFGQLEEFLG